MRVPTKFHISIDEVPGAENNPFPTRTYMENMSRTAGKIQLFQSPNERCNFLTQEVGEEPMDIYDANCKCLLCLKRFNLDPGIQQMRPGLVDLFQGDINDLVGKNLPAKSTISDTSSGFSITSKDKAIMASFTAMDEEEDIDMPLDPLGLTDDEEIHNFMTTHPGFEEDNEEETEDLAPQPQPVRSDRKIVKETRISKKTKIFNKEIWYLWKIKQPIKKTLNTTEICMKLSQLKRRNITAHLSLEEAL